MFLSNKILLPNTVNKTKHFFKESKQYFKIVWEIVTVSQITPLNEITAKGLQSLVVVAKKSRSPIFYTKILDACCPFTIDHFHHHHWANNTFCIERIYRTTTTTTTKTTRKIRPPTHKIDGKKLQQKILSTFGRVNISAWEFPSLEFRWIIHFLFRV